MDNHAVEWSLMLSEAMGQLARQTVRLMKYYLDIIHQTDVSPRTANSWRLSKVDTESFDVEKRLSIMFGITAGD